jgi:hypothetical protein
MRFFTRKALKSGGSQWEKALREYREHLVSLQARLPASVLAFDRVSIHDQIVERVERPSKSSVVFHTRNYEITFNGVSEFVAPAPPEGDVWLYNEVDLCGNGKVELRVLSELSEFRIVFESISVLDNLWPKWRVPPDGRNLSSGGAKTIEADINPHELSRRGRQTKRRRKRG